MPRRWLLAIPLALLLNSQMRTRNLQRTVFFFPSIVSALLLVAIGLGFGGFLAARYAFDPLAP